MNIHISISWRKTAFGLCLAIAGLSRAWAIDSGTLAQLLPLAQQSHPQAQYHVGMLYNNGIGGAPKNPEIALTWFLKAAQGGDALGAYKAGCYFAGQFGPAMTDFDKAWHWKLVAAQAGYSLAQHDVALMYAKAKDLEKALQYWKLAADQGFAPAALQLAQMHDLQPASDKLLAYSYLQIATQLEPRIANASVQALRERLAAALSPHELAQADAAASAWRPRPTQLTQQAHEGANQIAALLKTYQPQ